MNEIDSRILLNKSSAHLNYAQAKAAVANAILATEQARKVHIEADTADAISSSIVSQYYSDATLKEEKAKNMYNYGSEEAADVYDFGGNGELSGTDKTPWGSVSGKLGVNGNYHGYKSRH